MIARRRFPPVLVVVALLLAACTTAPPPPAVLVPQVATPPTAVGVLAVDDPATLAVATSAALYRDSPVVVLADDDATRDRAAPTARQLGVPLLITPGQDGQDPAGVIPELARLGVTTAIPVGEWATAWAQSWAEASRAQVVADPARLMIAAPIQRPDLLVLTADDTSAAAVTAAASGARVEAVTDPDPRVVAPAGLPASRVVGLGTAFGSPEVLASRLAIAAAGTQLPGGGQVLFPGRRMVALYGHPGVPALGVLGEQGIPESIARARALAAEYQGVSDQPVIPAFEIISTIADSGPGPDGDYSSEATVDFLRPWVEAAGAAGVYVLIDLQPGRADFLSQAQRYEELLALPHVGLALDPEWRLAPDQVHLRQIGSVGVDEVNAVADWLAALTSENALPQKMLMLHQFRLSMIAGRERLDTTHDELSVVIHADGFGTPDLKIGTWNALHENAPAGIHWGWKNFYDEDTPTFTAAQTLAVLPEAPVFVSFQ